MSVTPRLKQQYSDTIRASLKDSLELSSIEQVPKLEKIVINVGIGRNKEDKRAFETAKTTLRKITGQEPVVTVASKSIANFKLREGQNNGVMVTLRGNKMYEFADRLIAIVLPRMRDFHGVNHKSFDRKGNYTIGLKDQSIFPELSFEDVSIIHGLQISFVMSGGSDDYSKELLKAFGMPFEKGVYNAA